MREGTGVSFLDQTKIVVWDLDDTFWDGTLAEGDDVTYLREHHDLVVRLNRYGIVSSIASHNDPDRARAVLEKHGIWPYFVFPQIGWAPKHQMVEGLLAMAHLRPENAFFVDDKKRVREEVLAHVSRLLGAGTREEFSSAFHDWAVDRPESDPAMKRLSQYKLLEKRESTREEFEKHNGHSSADFLRASNIHCQVFPITPGLFDRVLELVNRTNQLNFTRKRLDASGLQVLLDNDQFECRGVHVKDRFGDYGVAGFFALDTSRHVLEHFLFSCRILQMGVEQALYQHLSCPALQADEEQRVLADGLASGERVDWVSISLAHEGVAEDEEASSHSASSGPKGARVLLVGPCDLLIVCRHIASAMPDLVELNSLVMYVNDAGRNITHFGHDSLLRLALAPHLREKHAATLERLGWLDEKLMTLPTADADVVVLSSVRNAQSATYTHRSGEFSVPFEYTRRQDQWRDMTRPESKKKFTQILRKYHCVDAGELESMFDYFSENFTFTGFVSGSAYKSTLLSMSSTLRSEQRLLVLNCPLVPEEWLADEDPMGQRLADQNAEINRAIEDAAREDSRIAVLDVNEFLGIGKGFMMSGKGLFDRLYHFERQVYLGLALEIIERLEEWGLVNDGLNSAPT